MAKQINVGYGGAVKKVKKVYASVSGAVKQIKKGYLGYNGAVKMFYESNIITSASTGGGMVNQTKTSEGYYAWSVADGDGDAVLKIYGDLAGASFSLTIRVDGAGGYITSCYPASSGGYYEYGSKYFTTGEDGDTAVSTVTGTFHTSASYVKIIQYERGDYGVYAQIRSFKINGEEKLPELLTALGK